MKSINFRGTNKVFGEGSSNPLHTYKGNGEVVTCWKFSFMERVKLLVRGKLYITAKTFSKPPQPLKLSLQNKIR